MANPKYANISIDYIGNNQNHLVLINSVKNSLEKNQASPEDVALFINEVENGGYNNIIKNIQKWVILNGYTNIL